MNAAAPPSVPCTTGSGPLPTAAQLPDDSATLKHFILELLATLRQERRDREQLQHRLAQLLQRLYGPRGERFRPDQPLLFAELAAAGAEDPAPPPGTEPVAEPKPKRRARPHGRRKLPDHLRRTQQHYTLTEAERLCAGCGQVRGEIGVDQSEQLNYEPASLYITEHIIHKYACPRCAGRQPAPVESTPMSEPTPGPEPASTPAPAPVATPPVPVVIAGVRPPAPLAKGLPGAGLLAHLIVSKYVDHLPLHRLERIYERQGYFLPRSTLCDWLAACADALTPLYTLMVSVVLQSRALHTDDTPIKNDRPPPGGTDLGRLWAYLGDADHPYHVFDFTPNRKRDGPQQFLKNYRGYLHADAFGGYDALYLPDPQTGSAAIVEVACNAHARRKFYEARDSDALRSHQALAYYGQLYEIERQAKALNADDALRLQMRQDFAVPILEQFHAWLQTQRADVLPKSPLGEAIGYALNHWQALMRYTEAGFLAIDNNAAEREMKRIALGRKNWLFVGSVQGGRTAAVLFSFTSTCQRLGVEPWSYLKDVLTRLPTTPAERLAELLPDRWQAARAAAADTAQP